MSSNSIRIKFTALLVAGLFFGFNQLCKAQAMYTVDAAPEADIIVFMVDAEDKCDLKVFFVEEEHQLGKPGVWMGTFDKSKADKKIYFTFEEKEATLKIFVVDKEEQAGWVSEEKKGLLEK